MRPTVHLRHCPVQSSAFNGDGRHDRALVTPVRDGQYRLVVRQAGKGRAMHTIDTMPAQALAEFYVSKADRADWLTWCANLRDRRRCPLSALRGKGDILTFGTREASRFMAAWDGKTFQVVVVND